MFLKISLCTEFTLNWWCWCCFRYLCTPPNIPGIRKEEVNHCSQAERSHQEIAADPAILINWKSQGPVGLQVVAPNLFYCALIEDVFCIMYLHLFSNLMCLQENLILGTAGWNQLYKQERLVKLDKSKTSFCPQSGSVNFPKDQLQVFKVKVELFENRFNFFYSIAQ